MMDSHDTVASKFTTLTPQGHIRRGHVVTAVVILLVTATMGEKITCDVPSVGPLEETRLTCYFPEDISQSMKDVTVYRHVLDGSPEAVLGCWWLNAHMECSARHGYLFDNVVTNHLSIKLPYATAEQTGTYACHVTGYKADDVKICEFVWTKDVTDHSSHKEQTIHNNYPVLHVVDGTIIGLLVFLLLLIALVMCYLRHRIRVKEVWGRFTQVFKDKELDPLVKNEEEDENSKRELEVPQVIVLCRSGRHLIAGWEGPAASRPESILEKSETDTDEESPEEREPCKPQSASGLEKDPRDSQGESQLEKKEENEILTDENQNETIAGLPMPVTETRDVDCRQAANETHENRSEPLDDKKMTRSDCQLGSSQSCKDLSSSTQENIKEQPVCVLESSENADSQCESLLGDNSTTDDGNESLLDTVENPDDQCESLPEDNSNSDEGSESLIDTVESPDDQCESLLGDNSSSDEGNESLLDTVESPDDQCESVLYQVTGEERPSSIVDETEQDGGASEKIDSEKDNEKRDSSLAKTTPITSATLCWSAERDRRRL